MGTPVRRILGIDPGTKRIGFAVSDEIGVARPLSVWVKKSKTEDLREIRRVIAEEEISEIYVGVPYKLEGGESASTLKAKAFLAEVQAEFPELPVHEQDEALTTWEADERLKAEGLSPEARRKKIDAYAAAVMLQEVLDKRAAQAGAPAPSAPGDDETVE